MSNEIKTGKSLIGDLSDLKARLEQDIKKIDDTINRIDTWTKYDATETEKYNGYWGYYILEEMTSLLNTASHISTIRNVIATAYTGAKY